jgi:hypothetical protein
MNAVQLAGYRVRQFWQALSAGPLPEEAWIDIRSVLAPAEFVLFERQSHGDQQHAYRVMRTLRSAGRNEPELLAAALLHDVGKSFCRTYWWDRPLVVLLQGLVPGWSARLASGNVGSWKRPFVVKEQHAEWGADAAKKAGCSATTVVLIQRHQDPLRQCDGDRATRLLAWLQWADDNN